MKHTNLSLSGIVFGGIISLLGLVRYISMWPDPDKALMVFMIGLLIIGVSWNYAGRIQLDKEIKKHEDTLIKVEDYIQDEVALKKKRVARK
jgi:hypothetical protein